LLWRTASHRRMTTGQMRRTSSHRRVRETVVDIGSSESCTSSAEDWDIAFLLSFAECHGPHDTGCLDVPPTGSPTPPPQAEEALLSHTRAAPGSLVGTRTLLVVPSSTCAGVQSVDDP
jgi:hypothetical protein